MTQDEIIEMARQAGSIDSEDVILTIYNAFASAEREACAKVCDELQDVPATEPHHCAEDIRARGE
jgi:hypothetical protein